MNFSKWATTLCIFTSILTTSLAIGEENPMVTLKTSMGDITLELYPDKAPETVKNFLQYVDDGFYNGTIFHRVISNFMIQGGGFDDKMNKKMTRSPIKNEAANGLKNDRGTIAMARTSNPNSATAQFFINTVGNSSLNFKNPSPMGIGYCVFGRVSEGLDVVDKIRIVETGVRGGMRDVPKDAVMIESAMRIAAQPEVDIIPTPEVTPAP